VLPFESSIVKTIGGTTQLPRTSLHTPICRPACVSVISVKDERPAVWIVPLYMHGRLSTTATCTFFAGSMNGSCACLIYTRVSTLRHVRKWLRPLRHSTHRAYTWALDGFIQSACQNARFQGPRSGLVFRSWGEDTLCCFLAGSF
jgi:hypothetical protein